MKFIVKVAIVEPGGGFGYLTLRECADYEDAELTRRTYLRRNPALPLIIEHSLSEEPAPTNFQKITKSPEALAEFLGSLPTLSSPCDDSFHRAFCDAENCPHNAERDNPLWWLGLTTEDKEH